MKYIDYLKINTECPFCFLKLNKVVKKEKSFYMTYSLAPYCKHHILIVPFRHVEKYTDLTLEEKSDLDKLLIYSINKIESLGHKCYSILLRAGEGSGETIDHLHYHIIPSMAVSSLSGSSIERPIMTKEEINEFIKDLGDF